MDVVAWCRMTSLLQKFRISFSEVIEVSGINDKPSSERWASFGNLFYPVFLTTVLCSVQKYHQLPGGSEAEDDKELDKLVRTLPNL